MTKEHSYIISDHLRAAAFIIADNVEPAAKGAGYTLRRLIRRSFSSALALGIDISTSLFFEDFIKTVLKIYGDTYPELKTSQDRFVDLLSQEAKKYLGAVARGEKEWKKVFNNPKELSGQELVEKAWNLYQTNGVPFEVSETEVERNNKSINLEDLEKLIAAHQAKSKEAGKVQFKSGLAGDSTKTRKLHTTTHILHKVLRDKFGDDLHQIGSAITDVKARFDVTLDNKLTSEELTQLEQKINEIVELDIPMNITETNPEQAKELGAIGLFGEKYGEKVTVYTLEDKNGKIYSREFCSGPHVNNTSEIRNFKFIKQKSIGAGKKRFEFDVE